MASQDTTFVSQTTSITTEWAQTINNAILKGRDPNYVTSTGTGISYIITLPTGNKYTSPVAGDTFTWKSHTNNIGSATITIVGATTLGPYSLTKTGSTPLEPDDIVSGAVVTCTYDGTRFQLRNVGSTSGGLGDMPLFTQLGTGAVARTFQNKEEDLISVRDFGAVGDGTTDDTDAITNADALEGKTYLPAGTYKSTVASPSLGGCFYGSGRIKDASNNYRAPNYATASSYPTSVTTNHTNIEVAFNGDLSKCQFPVEHRIIGATTLGQPATGYIYTPETSPYYTVMKNTSGWNNSTTSNVGRTGTAANFTVVDQSGQGDAFC